MTPRGERSAHHIHPWSWPLSRAVHRPGRPCTGGAHRAHGVAAHPLPAPCTPGSPIPGAAGGPGGSGRARGRTHRRRRPRLLAASRSSSLRRSAPPPSASTSAAASLQSPSGAVSPSHRHHPAPRPPAAAHRLPQPAGSMAPLCRASPAPSCPARPCTRPGRSGEGRPQPAERRPRAPGRPRCAARPRPPRPGPARPQRGALGVQGARCPCGEPEGSSPRRAECPAWGVRGSPAAP